MDRHNRKKAIIIIISDIIVTLIFIVLYSLIRSLLKKLNISLADNNAFCNILLDCFIILAQFVNLIIYNKIYHTKSFILDIHKPKAKYLLICFIVPIIIVFFSFLFLVIKKVITFSGIGFNIYNTSDVLLFTLIIFIQMTFVSISEELLFRGIIEAQLSKEFGNVSSVLISTAIFTAFHCTVISSAFQITDIFLLGLILGIVFIKTKNIVYTVIIHFLIDFSINIVSVKGTVGLFIIDTTVNENKLTYYLLGIMSLFSFIILIIGLFIIYNKKTVYQGRKR